jgi:hypothetical protein
MAPRRTDAQGGALSIGPFELTLSHLGRASVMDCFGFLRVYELTAAGVPGYRGFSRAAEREYHRLSRYRAAIRCNFGMYSSAHIMASSTLDALIRHVATPTRASACSRSAPAQERYSGERRFENLL